VAARNSEEQDLYHSLRSIWSSFLQRCVQFFGVKTHNHRSIDHDYGCSHYFQLLELTQRGRVLRNIAIVKGNVPLRKILFRPLTEHSTGL
jgi:hypothetical protein